MCVSQRSDASCEYWEISSLTQILDDDGDVSVCASVCACVCLRVVQCVVWVLVACFSASQPISPVCHCMSMAVPLSNTDIQI